LRFGPLDQLHIGIEETFSHHTLSPMPVAPKINAFIAYSFLKQLTPEKSLGSAWHAIKCANIGAKNANFQGQT
jgi:hypothetical protein